MGADVFLLAGAPGDGVSSYAYTSSTADTRAAYVLNSKFLKFRPHTKRNFVSGEKKPSFNQDGWTVPILFMGNMTCRGMQFQGRFLSSD